MSALPEDTIEGLYISVKEIIEASRSSVYRAANTAMVKAYWSIGKLIVEVEQQGKERAEYGTQMISQLSEKLTTEYGKGYTATNLKYMRQFYKVFEKSHSVRDQLSWTHYRLLMKVEQQAARTFYMEESVLQNWSTRTLERQINSLYYQRLQSSSKEGALQVRQEAEEQQTPLQASDLIKDPYVLEFTGLKPNKAFYEKELEQAIIDKLQEFLLELGKGFSFVSRQHRISLEEEHFYIDLVFYNYILKCFMLIDLKVGKLTHQDIGQMDTYVRLFESEMKQKDDNPTIGLILCTQKNKALAKYSLLNGSEQIFASKYITHLPSEEELQREIERERLQIEMEKKLNE